MTTALEQARALAAQTAQVSEDMNEAQAGGGSILLPSKYYFGRVCEYIDLGSQPQEFQGQAKDPKDEFRLGIALYGVDGDGKPLGDPSKGEGYIFRPFDFALQRNEKSATFKAFKALNWTKNAAITHFSQFLGEGFCFFVEEYEDAKKKKRNRIVWEKTLAADPATGQVYVVPPLADSQVRAFFWNFPTLETWAALKIEGTNDKGESKNFIQDKILGALNFDGSPLHVLLSQNNVTYNRPTQAAQAPATPAVAPAVPVTPATPNVAPAAAPAVAVAPAVATVPATPVVAAPLAQPPVSVAPAPSVAVPAAPALPVATPPAA